jgi:hypothetical protein
VACLSEMGNTNVFCRKAEGKGLLVRLRRRLEDNVRFIRVVEKYSGRIYTEFFCLKQRPLMSSFEQGTNPSCSIHSSEIPE